MMYYFFSKPHELDIETITPINRFLGISTNSAKSTVLPSTPGVFNRWPLQVVPYHAFNDVVSVKDFIFFVKYQRGRQQFQCLFSNRTYADNVVRFFLFSLVSDCFCFLECLFLTPCSSLSYEL